MKRYIDSDGFLLEDWFDDRGIHDALWRTAILDIINGTCSTDECYLDGEAFRHPAIKHDCLFYNGENDCSRDQVIMDQVSRKISHHPLPKVNIRISDKFFQTPDMWLWMKGIRGSNVCSWMFHFWNRISLPILLKRNERLWKKGEEVYWAKGVRGRYPFYAFHLMSWMTYVLPDSRMKRKVNRICLNYIIKHDPTNILLKYLNGSKAFIMWSLKMLIDDYQPTIDFSWQRMIDRLPPGIRLDKYDGPYPIDKDILLWVLGNEFPGCQEV